MLIPPTREQCERARQWRNGVLSVLRTADPLNAEQQEAFHARLNAPGCPHRYYAAMSDDDPTQMLGLTGLTGIQWENGLAEISLIIDPAHRDRGVGAAIVHQLLEVGFERLRLHTIIGECYENNADAIRFWLRIVDRYQGEATTLPRRKFWGGMFHDSMYFSLYAERFREARP